MHSGLDSKWAMANELEIARVHANSAQTKCNPFKQMNLVLHQFIKHAEKIQVAFATSPGRQVSVAESFDASPGRQVSVA
jgi:hypothetical protein